MLYLPYKSHLVTNVDAETGVESSCADQLISAFNCMPLSRHQVLFHMLLAVKSVSIL